MALGDAKAAFRERSGRYVQLDRLDDDVAEYVPGVRPVVPDRENGEDARPAREPARPAATGHPRP